MLAKVYSSAIVGLDAVPVEVEVDIQSQGLPSFTIVGLPDKAVEESKERVRSAIRNSGADFPARRITVNLAPADLPKEGPSYDLPIALGILLASGQIQADVSDALFIGELALEGTLRHTNGALPNAILAKEQSYSKLFLPSPNTQEAAIIQEISVYPLTNLLSLIMHLQNEALITPAQPFPLQTLVPEGEYDYDMKDVKGQEGAKRAMEIAAAGSHNILLKGPPGAGKTLLAKTLPSILPTLTFEEAIEVTKIYSISGLLRKNSLHVKRPFRNPHHTTSHIGLIGGSATPRPGEVSLSHRGVLFLDEVAEFSKQALEVLRQPLEDGYVVISRASGRVRFPSKFMLIAAHNPCPCGYYQDTTHACKCSLTQINRYQQKLSGPLLDRIDIHIDVPPVKIDALSRENVSTQESSSIIRSRIQKARDLQAKRFENTSLFSNSEMSTKHIKLYCPFSLECEELLRLAVTKMHLSARSYYRTIKVARTIADLEGSEHIQKQHIAESLQYRPKIESLL